MKVSTSQTYFVKLRHACHPPLNGITAECRVTTNQNGSRFVSGSPGGCSRDYFVASDQEAIKCLYAEHGAIVVSINH